jgi:regulator of protease activity HflC (stomatin/prohibitin superfamily)
MKKLLALTLSCVFALSACTRVETGEIGLRRGYDKTIQKTELQPGSFNQSFVGEVLLFPVKEIALGLDNLKPQTKDKSTLDDFDLTVLYTINPQAIYDLYTTRSAAMHATNKQDETLLMYNYLHTVANSSVSKAVAGYDALQVPTSRSAIEADVSRIINESLKNEKLDAAIHISQIQIRDIKLSPSIVESANLAITQQNTLLAKEVEVKTAEAEAKRLKALSGSEQSIRYMHAKALQDIAEGVKAGKVHSIVVPYDFKGIVNVGNGK